MSNKKSEDGSQVSLWGATKSIFKTVDCGLNASLKEFKAAAIEIEKGEKEKRNSNSIMRVEEFKITYLDGSRVESPELATELVELITKAIRSEDYYFKEIIELASVYKLDISSFLKNQEKLMEVNAIKDYFRKI